MRRIGRLGESNPLLLFHRRFACCQSHPCGRNLSSSRAHPLMEASLFTQVPSRCRTTGAINGLSCPLPRNPTHRIYPKHACHSGFLSMTLSLDVDSKSIMPLPSKSPTFGTLVRTPQVCYAAGGSSALFSRCYSSVGRECTSRLAGAEETAAFDLNLSQSRALQVGVAKADRPISQEAMEAEDEGEEQAISGGIDLIVGPMFAGKTTALLKRIQAEVSAGRKAVLVKSDKDSRYGLTAVVSHDGLQMPCWAVPSLATFRAKIGEEAYAKLEVIGIDEAQFFKDLYNFCQVAADLEGKTLIVAGLDGDYLRKSFGSVLDLIPLADSISKLSSRCELCGKPAHFTFRKTDDIKREVIGGTDVYMPVCRQHYLSGQIAIETARTVLDAHKMPSFQLDKSINE